MTETKNKQTNEATIKRNLVATTWVQELCHAKRILLLLYRERLVQEYESTGELLVELGSDQTSLHNPFNGGYYPVQVSES